MNAATDNALDRARLAIYSAWRRGGLSPDEAWAEQARFTRQFAASTAANSNKTFETIAAEYLGVELRREG